MQPTPPPRPANSSSSDPFESFDAVPLFMKSLPVELGGTTPSKKEDDLKEGETNPSDTLAALQALAYEGDPAERSATRTVKIAESFREQGNALFKQRKFRDAVGFYTRALDEVGKDLDVEARRTLWSNRAAANLELGNYASTLRDCSLVLSQGNSNFPNPPTSTSNTTTLKSLLRSARALSALEKLPEALDALDRLRAMEVELGLGEKQDAGAKWREEVKRKVEVQERREKEKRERERRKREGDAAVVLALTARGVIFPKPTASKPLFHSCPTDVQPPHFDPEVVPLTSLDTIPLLPPTTPSSAAAAYVPWSPPPPHTPLIFPSFVLFPLENPPVRDLVMAFPEDATFGDALLSIGRDPSSTQLYLATARGRVLKIGAKLTLGKVLEAAGKVKEGSEKERDGWELKEGWVLEMVGVPKGGEGEEWVQKWKEEVKEGKKAIL